MSSSKDIKTPLIRKDYGAFHPINTLKDNILGLLHSFGFEIVDGPEIESEI